jgi:hypothetical protein
MNTPLFQWAVIGAGPAGIASVGKLLDAGVAAADIVWLDPEFKVGDLGTAWRYVGSNTPVESFVKFYEHCEAFRYNNTDRPTFMIDKIAPNKNCPLMLAAQPLKWIAEHLSEKVNVVKDEVTSLTPLSEGWQLALASKKTLYVKKAILAMGGMAKELQFANILTIPLKTALNPNLLQKAIEPNDYVLVFGAAQSAKSVIEHVSPIETKKTVLFYRSERSLERHFHREKILDNIVRLEMTPKNLLTHTPHATKAIYAIGFERRSLPIMGLPADYSYNKKTGEIAPGLFGVGMAFPEILPYELGQLEYRVTAIWPFMKRLDKLMSMWL